MKIRLIIALSALVVAGMPVVSMAQDYGHHPTLSDNFTASIGYMRSSNSFTLSAEGTRDGDPVDPGFGNDIDFNDSLGVSDTSTFANAQLRWKFGKSRKWSIWGQYFSNNATGKVTLEEDVEWEDVIFREGTYVESGVKLAITRVFVGRSFYKNEKNDFGVGLGIHHLDLNAYIEGELIINDDSTGRKKYPASASGILPNIGAWYNVSPAKRWLVHSRIDWLNANIGDYSGGLWNASLGVNFQAWRHVGLDLSWQYFNLNVDVEKTSWWGSIDMTYSGPVLSATFNW